ncbi:MAG TPA: hypothetical protein VI749_05290 [Candidatus Omnitrophota bacterium]|nr:hypothetical protein [Candidatus Omnitrophota bacterium]
MNDVLIYLPFALSFLIGYLLISLVLKDTGPIGPLFRLSLAGGIGLGVSSYLTFLNFMVLDRFNAPFLIVGHATVLFLIFLGLLASAKRPASSRPSHKFPLTDILSFVGLIIIFIPIYYIATFYPYGGWDAWAVWHFKSKFLFLADSHWRNMFDPVLWRSSPHYPLLLPFINVWGWALQQKAIYQIPLITSLLFTFLTCSLLVSSLQKLTSSRWSFLTALVILTLPFYTKTAVSQYADVVLGYYTLAALVCLVLGGMQRMRRYCFLSGIFVGFLSFTKPEGLIASLLLMSLGSLYLLWSNNPKRKELLLSYTIGAAMTLIPSLLFYWLIAPANITSFNGFISQAPPSTLERLKVIFVYYLLEWLTPKWNGLLIILFLAVIAGARLCFRKETWVLPTFLFLYIAGVTLYYWMNTYFEILWWLSVTLNRVIASLLPVVLWWVFFALGREQHKQPPND